MILRSHLRVKKVDNVRVEMILRCDLRVKMLGLRKFNVLKMLGLVGSHFTRHSPNQGSKLRVSSRIRTRVRVVDTYRD